MNIDDGMKDYEKKVSNEYKANVSPEKLRKRLVAFRVSDVNKAVACYMMCRDEVSLEQVCGICKVNYNTVVSHLYDARYDKSLKEALKLKLYMKGDFETSMEAELRKNWVAFFLKEQGNKKGDALIELAR